MVSKTREPFVYVGKVVKVLDDGISLLMTLDLGFYSFVKNQKFTFLGVLPSDDPATRQRAQAFLTSVFDDHPEVIVETFKAVDGEFYIEIVDEDGQGMSRTLLELELAKFDENIREKFGIKEEEISNE